MVGREEESNKDGKREIRSKDSRKKGGGEEEHKEENLNAVRKRKEGE